MTKAYRSEAMGAIHETMQAAHDVGAIDQDTMANFNDINLKRENGVGTVTTEDVLAQARQAGREALASPLVQQARLFAIAAHGATGQRRKGTLEPYIVHPEAVAGIVALFGGDEAMQTAAWLHDVVEDTELDLDTIEQAFGTDVATLVSAVTKPEAEGQGRADRVATARASLASASSRAQTIKLADIFHNLSGSENLTKAFRKIYLPEKKADVEAMQKADERLQGMLKELLAILT